MACITSALDGGSSVFTGSLPKNVMLVAVDPRIGQRYGNIITSIITTDRHPRWLAWGRRMHRGCIAPSPSSAGMRWLNGAMAYGPRRSRLIFVGDADEAPDSGSPFVEPLLKRRKVEEHLRARARAFASVGGSESCMDCDALRLLTTLEGSLPQPCGCPPFPPAPRRACWPSLSREGRAGLFPGRRLGSPAGWRCSSRTTWEERAVGPDIGVLEAAAPPSSGMETPLEGLAPPAGGPTLSLELAACRPSLGA